MTRCHRCRRTINQDGVYHVCPACRRHIHITCGGCAHHPTAVMEQHVGTPRFGGASADRAHQTPAPPRNAPRTPPPAPPRPGRYVQDVTADTVPIPTRATRAAPSTRQGIGALMVVLMALVLGGWLVGSGLPGAVDDGGNGRASTSDAASGGSGAGAAPTRTPTSRRADNDVATSREWLVVGNTGGIGVYIRRTPNMDDKIQAFPDGTLLQVIGDDARNEGRDWKHVRVDGSGLEGWVPAEFTIPAQASAQPTIAPR